MVVRQQAPGDALAGDDRWVLALRPLPRPRIAFLADGDGGPFMQAAAEALASEVAGEVVSAAGSRRAGFLLVEGGKAEGACCWQSSQKLPSKGFWFAPTIFTGCAQSHRIVQEEVFGPVLAVQTFRTPKEAIEKANNTPYGLSGGVWTDKGSKIFTITNQIRAGVLWANTFNKFDPGSPFGGYKESGVGREGGLHGLHPYVELT